MSTKNYKRGVSQHWIVPLGGCHADEVAVSNWLSGRNEPTLRNLLRLSTALRTDPAELLTDESVSTTR